MAPHSPPSVEHASAGAEPTQLLRNAMLKSLSGAQRLIILLRYAEQMTDAEIAGAVDMTTEQVEPPRRSDSDPPRQRRSAGRLIAPTALRPAFCPQTGHSGSQLG